MTFDKKFFDSLAAYISIGETTIKIVMSMIAKYNEIKARGTAPTSEQLHAIAIEARMEFEALPKPK
jgi:hypothetical protein